MNIFFKITYWLLGVMLVLPLTALIILIFVVDPNDYKPQLTYLIQEKIGRAVIIDGDIRLAFFPWLGLDLGNIRIGNALGFTKSTFASAEHVQIWVKVTPLFKKRLELGPILLENLVLVLTRRPDGHNNWEDLFELRRERSPYSTVTDFNIESLDIRNAQVILDDGQEKPYQFTNLHLKTGEIALNEPIRLRLSFNLTSNHTSVHFKLDTQLAINLKTQYYQLFSSRLRVDLVDTPFSSIGLNIPKATLDLNRQFINLKKLSAQLDLPAGEKLDLGGNLQVHNLLMHPTITGQFATNEFNLRRLLMQMGLKPPLPVSGLSFETASLKTQFQGDLNGITLTDLRIHIDDNQLTTTKAYFNLVQDSLHLEAILLNALGVNLNADLVIKQLSNQPHFEGMLTVEPFNPHMLFKRFKQKIPQLPIPLTQASLKTHLLGTPQAIVLTDLYLASDEHQLNSKQVNFDFTQGNTQVENLTMRVLGLKLTGALKGNALFSSHPTLVGEIVLAEFNPHLLLERLGQKSPEIVDPTTLQVLALKTCLQTDFTSLHLKKLSVRLDNSQLQGNVQIDNFQQPAIAFSLMVDTLDLDRYLSSKNKRKNDETTTLPIKQFEKLSANGTLQVGQLKIAGLKMANAILELKTKEGKFRLSPQQQQYLQEKDGEVSTHCQFDQNSD